MTATIANNPDTGGTFTQPVPYSMGRRALRENGRTWKHSTGGGPVGVGDGWYSYNLGAWHIISLNIECETQPGGCTGSWFAAELAWLKKRSRRESLRVHSAYWHQPTFSAANSIAVPEVRPLWPFGNCSTSTEPTGAERTRPPLCPLPPP